MTIRHRITLLVILTFVALSIIGGYAVYQTRASAQKVRQVTEGVVPSALASADLVSQVKAVQIATMTLVYAPDDTVVEQALGDLRKLHGEIDRSLARQAEGAAGDAQKGLVTQARESVENYFNAINDTAKLKQAGKTEMAQAFLFAMVAQYRDELEGVVNTLRVEKNRQKDSAITTLNDTLATTTTAIGIVTGLAIVLLTAIGALLYRQITRPLSRMQAMMSEIANSQDFTRRVPVGRMDEIGHSIVAFNGMIEKIQERSAQLKQKTADIQAMLQNMQQGILTVVDGSKVHGEYSAYLEAIFETQDVAGRGVMELVFGQSDLGSDALSQVEAAIDACIGQDAINFAFNEHLLVGEIGKRMPDGRVKQLDLTWSAITDESDTILRLMLCVRDVTELRELAAEANEQKQRLEMIGEILAVSQEKFHHFIESSSDFIRENERIIRKHSQADSAAIAELFRNMHTIKGNARTYNLQYLTNVVHETEQSYHELRQPDVARVWDQDGMMRELERVREAVDAYAYINEISLGRKGPGRAADEQSMVVDRAHIRASLRMLEAADPNDLHQLVAMRDAVHQTLRLLGTEGVGEALGAVLDSLPSLARELGKPAPVVRIDDNGYRLRAPAVRILRDVFMHLLRNSMDHGLEGADERRAKGKPAAGTIDIEVGLDHNMLQVTLTDDGRGLALHRIRSIAVQRGWITAETYVTDEQIAQFIFRPGFSTASEVTEVSGRGVGMDAVQDFVRREHGRIELRFTDERKGAEFRQFQTVVCLPDNLVVDGFDLNSVAADAVDLPALDAVVPRVAQDAGAGSRADMPGLSHDGQSQTGKV
ncbi:MCP four helix bundle domain-containing protein [Pandoraea faecigallinarum]|uniref:MCP four helix bundle domain-containing protein n=1 Tax=Pandoraea faecigallinarum TaxID=656179 RepID=UPI000AFEC221|nr:MCP four helix bundle domain-containing protein [Pandoraea faecigallinarum]